MIEEIIIKPRPKTTNLVMSFSEKERETPSELGKKKSRSKSARKSAKKDDYVHKFYSNSWRIHSEFIKDEPDRLLCFSFPEILPLLCSLFESLPLAIFLIKYILIL